METSTYGSELVAIQLAVDMIKALKYKLWMFRIGIMEDETKMYGDNNAVILNTSVPEFSDITTADGSRMNEEFLCDRDQFDGRRNDFLWPVKHDGNKSDWLEWRKFMEFVYNGGNLTLDIPLHTWQLESEDEWKSHWDWFVDDLLTFLYRQSGENIWQRHV